MSDNDRTTDLRRDRPDSDRRDGGSVRDLRARRRSDRQSVMGRLTVPSASRRDEPSVEHPTVTLREPDQLPLPGLRPVNDRDQQTPPTAPTPPEESQRDERRSAAAAAPPISLAPPPTETDDRRTRHPVSADPEPSGLHPPANGRRRDLRRNQTPTSKRDRTDNVVAAAGGPRRRAGLVGLAGLGAVIAAVVIATAVLSNSGSPSARTHASSHSATMQSASFAGQDPRAIEHPKPPPPQLRAQALEKLGTGAMKAAAVVKRRPHHSAASPAVASAAASETTTIEQPAETTTDQPAETTSTPSYTPTQTTPVETTPTTTPAPPSGGSSSNGGGSSSNSSSSKTPDYGPTGALGPGSSPDG